MFKMVRLAAVVLCAASASASVFRYSPDIQIGYDVQGDGPASVVLVHGLAASKEAWDLFTPRLLEVCRCRVYRMDLRGHGDSSAPNDHGYSVVENARILRAFFASEKLRGVILVGHSYGGAVALETALNAKREDPGLVQKLVLISTPAVQQRFSIFVQQNRHEEYGNLMDHVMPAQMRALLVVHGRNPRVSAGTRARVRLYSRLWKDPARCRAARQTAKEFLGGGLQHLADREHDTGIPTLVIAGTRDHLVSAAHGRELADSIPGARFELIRGTGHAMHEDAPGRVIAVLADFLRYSQRPTVASAAAMGR